MTKRATAIAFANYKGGVGKTTSAIMTAYILSQRGRVLCVDMDGQSDCTEALMGQSSDQFDDQTVREAMIERNPIPYIRQITPSLHLLPANDLLPTINPYIYLEIPQHQRVDLLRQTLEPVRSQYDWIVIDSPPSNLELLLNSLTAADYVVVMFKPAPFCEFALERFFETIESVVEESNQNLRCAGILPTMVDLRRSDVRNYIRILKEDFGDLVFETMIKQKASVERFTIGGIFDNPELDDVVESYMQFVDELIERMGGGVVEQEAQLGRQN